MLWTGINDTENSFEAASRKTWLYVGRVQSSVTTEIVTKCIRNKTKTDENIICEQLKTIGTNKAFKIGVDSKYHEMLYNSEF